MSTGENSLEEKLRSFRLARERDQSTSAIVQHEAEEERMDSRHPYGGYGGGEPGRRNDRPKNLRGKDIGMFYANRRGRGRGRGNNFSQGDHGGEGGPWRGGRNLQRRKNRERMAYENGDGGRDAARFRQAGDSRDDDVITGGEIERPPPGLKGRALGLFYRDRQTKRKKEAEKRKAVDITIPQWQIDEIRRHLNLEKGQEKVDFFKHFVENNEIDSVFKNEYLRVIEKSLCQVIAEQTAHEDGNTTIDEPIWKETRNEQLYEEYMDNDNVNELTKFRERLPAFNSRREILEMIDKNQVILVKGETGSGKTTQIPQYILEQATAAKKGVDCRIICTQPRRISAITLAERVAAERGESLGRSVGYQIRLDSKRPRDDGASIMFCTTGIVLTILQSDPCLKGYSHLILDEIHERDVITDLLLAIVKLILPYRKDLKVILMSATLTAGTFSKYFFDCPTVEIPGITFPVEEIYLEDIIRELNFHEFTDQSRRCYLNSRQALTFFDFIDRYVASLRGQYPPRVLQTISNPQSELSQNDLIVALIHHITVSKPEGAILVFLPSLAQISDVHKLLTADRQLSQESTLIYPLHSKVPQLDQKAVFSRPARGVRKIILATNIAETSITIDDVVYVINAGRHKINMYEDGVSTLRDEWISISNEIQRKGRAGRVQPGICYHLYTRARRNVLQPNTPPEVLRVALEEVILNIKILGLGDARRFMERLIDCPDEDVIQKSLTFLNQINALDNNETLTPLGYHLARLPMDPRTGKMVLLSSIFSCTDPISSIAASLSFKDAFYKPFGKELQVHAAKKRFAGRYHSDHMMMANVISQWRTLQYKDAQSFAYRNFLNLATLNQLYSMKGQFCEYLHSAKFLETAQIEAKENNRNSTNDKLVTAIIGAGLYPNVAFVRKVIRKRNSPDGRSILAISGLGRATIHPSSVNGTLADFESNFVVYYDKQKISSLTIFDTTVVNPFPLFFFGDNHVETEGDYELISIAGHYCLKCNKETYRLIQDLREGFNLFLQKKICQPSPVDWNGEEGKLLRAIIQLITIDGMYEDGFDDDDNAREGFDEDFDEPGSYNRGGPNSRSYNPEEIQLFDEDEGFDYFNNDDLPTASTSSSSGGGAGSSRAGTSWR
ncbi:ATP-dependent DNA/RNA helicase DHX36 [Uranotaenia lowii]|uniref:ATP-dependent DNA/RNA helicase DHX36 n=1 Tax=Uranotaenia lowii TaxID=190385 RepID=UPI00247ABC3A|nr:ATP-dependent DNA/RNA helicase DHX36 [Uranotaenia lowii]